MSRSVNRVSLHSQSGFGHNHSHGSSSDASINTVFDTIGMCGKHLTTLAQHLAETEADHSDDFLQKCTDEMLELGKSVADVEKECRVTKEALRLFQDTPLEELTAAAGAASSCSSATAGTGKGSDESAPLIKKLRTDIKASMEADSNDSCIIRKGQRISPQTRNADLVVEIRAIMGIDGQEEEKNGDSDDDVQALRTEPTEADFKCCITTMPMTVPLKNIGKESSCKHHISQEGFQSILQNRQYCRCPMPGCNGIWRRDGTAVDKVFQMKFHRFQRAQKQGQGMSQSNNSR